MAAEKEHTDTVRLLLDRGADINASDVYGYTALLRAAEGGHTDNVRLLLDRGADINVSDDNGHTALSLAAMEGITVVIHTLLYHQLCYECGRIPFVFMCNALKYTPRMSVSSFVDYVFVLRQAGCPVDVINNFVAQVYNNELPKEVADFLEELRCTIPQLIMLCRTVIRSHLATDVNNRLTRLQLPKAMEEFLKLQECTDLLELKPC
jgi:hypothetical protein